MINLDAHFDLRTYEQGQHSGSWARQLMDEASEAGKMFHYLPIGVNPAVNNRALFKTLQNHNQTCILLEELQHLESSMTEMNTFINKLDHVCLTLDLDVISAAHAPGVSAPAAFGISPELTVQLIMEVQRSGKLLSLDIAELNPKFDDGRTAKLAAQVIYQVAIAKFRHQ